MPDIKAREPSLARTALVRAARVAAPKVTFPTSIDPKAAAQFDIDVNTFDTYHAEATLKNTSTALAPFKSPRGFALSEHFDVFLSLHTRAMNPTIDRTRKKYAAVEQVIANAEAQINAAWNASNEQGAPLSGDTRQRLTALQSGVRTAIASADKDFQRLKHSGEKSFQARRQWYIGESGYESAIFPLEKAPVEANFPMTLLSPWEVGPKAFVVADVQKLGAMRERVYDYARDMFSLNEKSIVPALGKLRTLDRSLEQLLLGNTASLAWHTLVPRIRAKSELKGRDLKALEGEAFQCMKRTHLGTISFGQQFVAESEAIWRPEMERLRLKVQMFREKSYLDMKPVDEFLTKLETERRRQNVDKPLTRANYQRAQNVTKTLAGYLEDLNRDEKTIPVMIELTALAGAYARAYGEQDLRIVDNIFSAKTGTHITVDDDERQAVIHSYGDLNALLVKLSEQMKCTRTLLAALNVSLEKRTDSLKPKSSGFAF